MWQEKRAGNRVREAAAGVIRRIQRMKTLSRVLLAAAILLAAAAVVTYVQLDSAGVMAEKRAADLLDRVQAPAESAAVAVAITQPEPAGEASEPRRVLQDIEDYRVIAKLTIPALGLELPVLAECSDAALKVSVCRLTGPSKPGDAGNLVVTGHNYRSGAHFGRLDELKADDEVILMDVWGNEYRYHVIFFLTMKPDDMESIFNFE